MDQNLILVVMPSGALTLEWSDADKTPLSKSSAVMQTEIYHRYTESPEDWLLFLGFCDPKVPLSASLAYLRDFAGLFTRKLTMTPDLEDLRDRVQVDISSEELDPILEGVPMMTGAEYLNRDRLHEIWEAMNRAFVAAIRQYDGSVAAFVKTFSPDIHLVGRVFFHLVENKSGDRPFAFLATYSTGLNQEGQSKHLPLKNALTEYADDQAKLLELLATVRAAEKHSQLVADLSQSGELFHPLAWTAGEAFTFLNEIPIYEEAGILCRIPNWWKGKASSLRMKISLGDASPSFVNMDAILSFNAHLMLGDVRITEEEARQLIEEAEGLAFIKNKWVAVDPEKLKQTLEAYAKAREMADQGVSIREAMRLQLNPEQFLGDAQATVDTEITHGDWLQDVIQKLHHPELTAAIKPGPGFKADLRKYQQKGVNWLAFLHSLQFGACLADDMGLGKTVQLLGFLSYMRNTQKKNASLLVIPASLIANWHAEIKRFFPKLKYFIAHPSIHPQKRTLARSKNQLNALDLVITTYTLARKYKWIEAYTWAYVILDEAQAIKNPGTKQTQSIKALQAHNRIIMTGTPIENRLGDLWSLFDFLNPGLLGSKTEFGRFIKKLKSDAQGYARLRQIISPYILRRLKTDKNVIQDLPDKVEMKTYASLSKKQIVLYREIVNEIRAVLDDAEGIQRKGLVLASLMKFKQLCNHPDQYMGSGAYDETHSGKFQRLREICDTIYAKREKVLVFTQFKEITQPLSDFLETVFERPGLILHGGVAVGKRKKIIEQFQSDRYVPFMVLSLKAGGVGLNLTRANHVIHFDRWWNPAVENQATDRAFRIGQQKNVVVHKFITKGTIEEKIDAMLEEKAALSDDVVAASGENQITEMDSEELMEMFTLSL